MGELKEAIARQKVAIGTFEMAFDAQIK